MGEKRAGTGRVVVGVDGSVASFVALDAAAAEARRRGGGLEVITCASDRDECGPVLGAAAGRVAEHHRGLTVITTAAVGDPAEVLADRGRDAELVVVGSRGIGGAAGLLLRSVGQRVSARISVPLLVVRSADPRHTAPRHCADGVLLGLESDGDADAALFAFEEAQLRGTRLDVLHAWTYRQNPPPNRHAAEPTEELIARQAVAAAELPREVVAPLRRTSPRIDVETRSVRSVPCRALIAATANAQLVVIGAHRRSTRLGPQLGPVTTALLHHSHCPVAVVPVPEA
jgi:nucleotide-binding universal stress UspA family protein